MTRVVRLCALLIPMAACAGIPVSVQLIPEERTTLHVGEIGALSIPPNQDYSIGTAQTSLALFKAVRHQGRAVYFYRAVSAGNDTFVLTPVGLQNGQCISCVTVHYFVTVVP